MTPEPRRAILINGNAYRRQQPAAPNFTEAVLHTICSALALGLFVLGGLMMIVALA
jgi:hypothetical protein